MIKYLLKLSIGILMGITAFYACSQNESLIKKVEDEKIVGFDLSNIDTTVNLKDDFYNWAVGGWRKNNPIPDDQVRWGAFTMLVEKARDQVKTIIDDAVKESQKGAAGLTSKVGTFYSVGMDTVKIEKLGLSPLNNELKRIDALKNKKDMIKEIAHMHKYTSAPLFFFYSTVDAKNSDSVIAGMWQGGLGLPDRDYYVKNDERSKEIRKKYLEHLNNMFALTDDKNKEQSAGIIMKIETRLAKASNTRLENRDPNRTYNKLTTKELAELMSGFDLWLYLKEIEAGDPGKINVSQPKFFKEVGKYR